MSEVIPFGGENLPVKELKKQAPAKEEKEIVPKKKTKLLLFVLIGVIVFLLLIIVLLLFGKKEVKPLPSPTPSAVLLSPSPQATPSAFPKTLSEKIEDLEKKLKETQLHKTDLAFPILDFNFNFEQKKK